MNKFTKQLRRLIGASCITLIIASCAQEVDMEIVDPAVKSTFETELAESLELMEDNSTLAIEKLDKIIADAEKINSKYYAGKAKWYKAYIYDDIVEDVSLAYQNYNEALKDVLQTDDALLSMNIYNNLGILYRFYGQYDAAISNYEAALKLKDRLPVKELPDVYYNYGVALKLKGDSVSFFKAEEAFTTSLKYAEEVEAHKNIAIVHNQIGLMYKTVGNYEMARIAYNHTIRKYINNPDLQERVGKAYHGIGVSYMEEGNADAAIDAFKKALEYKNRSGSIFITKYDLGTILQRVGRTDEAIAMWEEALQEKHNKNSIEQVQIYSDLTSALKVNNQYKKALGYYETYNSSIQNILEEGEKYKSESDQVLFANVINEYDEFNKPVPFFSRPVVMILMTLLATALVYVIILLYYRSRSRREVSDAVSRIQTKFMDIKVD